MSKVIYREIEWLNANDSRFKEIKEVPVCPRCNELTYGADKCQFCGEELEYE